MMERKIYKHYKNGEFYELIHGNVMREGSGERYVVYRNIETDAHYTRPHSEFFGEARKGVDRFTRDVTVETRPDFVARRER
jgi:hypothetical protein